jgi:ketosteroid isomerase-like protein
MAFTELLSLFTRAVEDADVDAFLELFHGDATYGDVFDGVFTGHAQIRNTFEVNFHGRARDFRWHDRLRASDAQLHLNHEARLW